MLDIEERRTPPTDLAQHCACTIGRSAADLRLHYNQLAAIARWTEALDAAIYSIASQHPEGPSRGGRRRAMAGYVPQYLLAAEAILQKLRVGDLLAVRVADPDAGAGR